MSVLLEAAEDLSAALVVCTHDPTVAGRLGERWRMIDGRLPVAGDEQEASGSGRERL